VSNRSVPWALGALALSAGFVALGVWQLGRGEFKELQRAAFERQLAAAPAALAGAVDAQRPTLPLRVAGAGRYEADATLLLDNQTLDGRAGVHVLTVFRPDGARRGVLVDRGFVALPPDRRAPPIEAPAASSLAGMLAAPPAAGIRLGDARAIRGAMPSLVPWLDVARVAKDFDVELADAVVLLDERAPDGFTRRWEPLRNTIPPERHRAYAVQWFALAAAVWVTYGVLLWRHRRPK